MLTLHQSNSVLPILPWDGERNRPRHRHTPGSARYLYPKCDLQFPRRLSGTNSHVTPSVFALFVQACTSFHILCGLN